MTDLDRAELRRLEQRYQDGYGDISVLVRGMRAEVDGVKRLAGRASERVALQRRAEAAEELAESRQEHLKRALGERLHFEQRAVLAEAAIERVRTYIESDPSISLEPMSPGAIILAALAPVTEEGGRR